VVRAEAPYAEGLQGSTTRGLGARLPPGAHQGAVPAGCLITGTVSPLALPGHPLPVRAAPQAPAPPPQRCATLLHALRLTESMAPARAQPYPYPTLNPSQPACAPACGTGPGTLCARAPRPSPAASAAQTRAATGGRAPGPSGRAGCRSCQPARRAVSRAPALPRRAQRGMRRAAAGGRPASEHGRAWAVRLPGQSAASRQASL